jgi:glycerophosphoryl diester phosphodiesterase
MPFLILMVGLSLAMANQAVATPGVRARFAGDEIVVVAHRGCHNPAPRHDLPAAPENSIAALDHCVRLGVDMMETDVRRTADGELVIIHDDTLDRTTTGHGPVRSMTLAELRTLRLRENLGGKDAAPTEHRIVTLDEMLRAARGRMLLNLDVKDAVYSEVIDAVVRAGMTDQVVLKTLAGPNTPPLASMAPYDRVPFIPILPNSGARALGMIAERQTDQAHPVAIELPVMTPAALPNVAAVARSARVPLWVNTLWDGFIKEWGGDVDALRDPDAVWGRMYRAGITIFQTDEPEALTAFRARRRPAPSPAA